MKLSIITINRNNYKGLQKTIESVVTQSCSDFEYIIIDGASTDSSVELIEGYKEHISYWVSEPDHGVYNAMNKGIKIARGEYLLFLNSGDWLYDDKVISDFMKNDFTEGIVAGNLMNWDDGKESLRVFYQPNELEFKYFYQDTAMAHQATFIKKELFSKFGLYNENHLYVSDWEFFIVALVINNCSYSYFDRTISYYDLSGMSAQEGSQKKLRQERDEVLNRYMPLVAKSFASIIKENDILKSHEHHYNQYMRIKNGKLSILQKMLNRLSKMLDK